MPISRGTNETSTVHPLCYFWVIRNNDQKECSLYNCQMGKASYWVVFTHDPFRERNKNCWERQSRACSLWIPTSQIRMGLGPVTYPYQRESPLSLGLGREHLHLSGSVCALLWCLNMAVNGPQAHPHLSVFQTLSRRGKGWSPSPIVDGGRKERGIHKSTDKSVAGEVGGCPASNEGLMPIIEADLVLFLHK